MLDSNTSVLEARPDWLTITAKDPIKQGALTELGEGLVRIEAGDGNVLRPWTWKKYQGEHCGRATWGRRPDSSILQLSAALAGEWFRPAYDSADRVTRIDLCVTVRWQNPRSDVSEEAYASGSNWEGWRGQKPTYTRITSTDGGATLYVGKRESDLFGRIYDKYAESRNEAYRHCWRYELEIKGDMADRASASLARSADSANYVLGCVRHYYSGRGITCPWPDDPNVVPLRYIRPSTDGSRKLLWLAQSVRPTVRQLVDMGLGSQVYAALRLPMPDATDSDLDARAGWGSHGNPWLGGDGEGDPGALPPETPPQT